MKTAAIAARNLPDSIIRLINSCGCDIIKFPFNPRVADPVRYHPDMSILRVGGCVVSAPHITAESDIAAAVRKHGLTFVSSDTIQRDEYPYDCAFNALRLGDFLYCRSDTLAPEAAEAARESGIAVVNVAQGYAACSTLKVDERSIVTADKSIARAAKNNGADVLLIQAGFIELEGYGCGFIGGASAVVGGNVILFGNRNSHPDAERIIEFCRERGKNIIDMPDMPLTDFGGLLVL